MDVHGVSTNTESKSMISSENHGTKNSNPQPKQNLEYIAQHQICDACRSPIRIKASDREQKAKGTGERKGEEGRARARHVPSGGKTVTYGTKI